MKKILSLLVCFAMLFTLVSALPASAETLTPGADGYYEIATADDYIAFVSLVNGGNLSANARLTADVDLSGKTVKPIGTYSPISTKRKSYTGTFDGNGRVITNLTIEETYSDEDNSGFAMFAMANGATIKNLGLENAAITITQSDDKDGVRLGVLVCAAGGTTSITGCYVKNSTLKAVGSGEVTAAGPIAANLGANANAENCYAIDSIVTATKQSKSAGCAQSGFVGFVSSSTTAENIKNCYTKNVTVTNFGNIKSFARFGDRTDVTCPSGLYDSCFSDKEATTRELSSVTVVSNSTTPSWATLHTTLGETAWKADTYSVNGGAPRLAWEADPAVYNITVDGNIANGTVSADKTSAAEGAQVTLTVTPDFNYEVDEVKFNNTVITAEDGVYSFEMPEAEVTVTATFRQILQKADGYYLIYNADDYVAFVELANKDLSINGKLMADIDMTTATVTVPADLTIGNFHIDGVSVAGSTPYMGIFDGNNRVIRNLSITRELDEKANAAVAMFAATRNATIKNLGIENAYVYNPYTSTSELLNYCGGVIIGCGGGTTLIENCYVKNSTVERNQKVNGEQWQNAGIIAGKMNSSTVINNCYSVGNTFAFKGSTLEAGGYAIAGFVGEPRGTITNSYAKGTTFPSNGKAYSFARVETAFATCYTDIDQYVSDDFTCGANVIGETELRAASLLGDGFKTDFYKANGGFPMLAWEDTTGLVKDIDFVYSGTVTENGAITKIKLEKADDTALTGKLYVAVFSGDALSYVKLAVIDACRAGVNEVDIEDITLSEGEALKVFVWDNTLVPLMYAIN